MERPETKNGKKPEHEQSAAKDSEHRVWTQIGAIEQIVDLAVELELETSFHENAHSALAYVAEW